ncbi:MAG: hypothetical protein ACREEY_08560 [Brevundimonas sp.]
MSDDQHTAAARDAGLTGWKASVHTHPKDADRKVCVLISPDFNPMTGKGVMISRPGRDPADAFARALEAAKGSIH